MIAFGEEQFQDHTSITFQFVTVRFDHHAFSHHGAAGWQELGNPGDFDDAQSTSAPGRQAFEVTE